MAAISLSPALRAEYQDLFETCVLRLEDKAVIATAVTKLCSHRAADYLWFEAFGFPWFYVGILHVMESGMDWSRHLHNGDPLTARTVHVPIGRPRDGEPPFTWRESALDALRYHTPEAWTDWTVAGLLYRWESWNGFGYRLYHHIATPYLWSMSRHYRSGKYAADGMWSPTLVSKQVGAAVMLKELVARNEVILTGV